MFFVKIDDKHYPAKVDERTSDSKWGGRASMTIDVEMSYTEAVAAFKNDAKWSIVKMPPAYVDENGKTIIPDHVERDCSEFCVAGSITDHRNGTLTVKMGKLTDLEETLAIFYGGVE